MSFEVFTVVTILMKLLPASQHGAQTQKNIIKIINLVAKFRCFSIFILFKKSHFAPFFSEDGAK
jgi:hypothetical protein